MNRVTKSQRITAKCLFQMTESSVILLTGKCPTKIQ